MCTCLCVCACVCVCVFEIEKERLSEGVCVCLCECVSVFEMLERTQRPEGMWREMSVGHALEFESYL